MKPHYREPDTQIVKRPPMRPMTRLHAVSVGLNALMAVWWVLPGAVHRFGGWCLLMAISMASAAWSQYLIWRNRRDAETKQP